MCEEDSRGKALLKRALTTTRYVICSAAHQTHTAGVQCYTCRHSSSYGPQQLCSRDALNDF